MTYLSPSQKLMATAHSFALFIAESIHIPENGDLRILEILAYGSAFHNEASDGDKVGILIVDNDTLTNDGSFFKIGDTPSNLNMLEYFLQEVHLSRWLDEDIKVCGHWHNQPIDLHVVTANILMESCSGVAQRWHGAHSDPNFLNHILEDMHRWSGRKFEPCSRDDIMVHVHSHFSRIF
jgi:hypothetical protein